MFEILHYMVQEIAQEPTKHSWAVPIMKLTSDDADIAMDRVDRWIQRMMKILHPEADQAERLVRIIWPNLLEAEALQSYKVRNSFIMSYVPIVYTPEEAVYVASFDVVGVTDEDSEAAIDFLRLMQDGDLAPSIPVILTGLREEIIKEDVYEEDDEEEEVSLWEHNHEDVLSSIEKSIHRIFMPLGMGLDPEQLPSFNHNPHQPFPRDIYLEHLNIISHFIESDCGELSDSLKELFYRNSRFPDLYDGSEVERKFLSDRKDQMERKIDRATAGLADTLTELISLCVQIRWKEMMQQSLIMSGKLDSAVRESSASSSPTSGC